MTTFINPVTGVHDSPIFYSFGIGTTCGAGRDRGDGVGDGHEYDLRTSTGFGCGDAPGSGFGMGGDNTKGEGSGSGWEACGYGYLSGRGLGEPKNYLKRKFRPLTSHIAHSET